MRSFLPRLMSLLPIGLAAAQVQTGSWPPAQGAGGAEETDAGADAEPRPFRIPDHGAAKSSMDRADEHAAAGRFGEAITELQGVLEDHRGDLLPSERPLVDGRDPSAQPVFPGAARRARERLLRLPPEARALYCERFEHDADAAFERARARGDRGTLAEVARRWPLTDACQRAWWAIGDLEMERGEADKAHAAWSRALSALLQDPTLSLSTAADWARVEARLAEPQSAGARRRVAAVRAGFASAEATAPSASASAFADALHPTPSMPASRAAATDLDSWPEPRVLPSHPFGRPRDQPDALFPVRAGDALLVSTSLRLLALHAWSGAVLWDSGEPEGWSSIVDPRERTKFFEGIDTAAAIVAPAAGGRVALAALQIPVTFVDRYYYSTNVPVTTVIPDRRLFAFDLESGRPLWSHEPPPSWDGESGDFAQRMSVAGPPIVCGSRVLAPFYRLQGRIDYHVGCFDLETGKLLWSTALISGQRELNMFGRAEHEFSAPPLVVSGDRVIALTQLGAVASLDLFTGELLWETLYDQIPLPKNTMGIFRAPPRRGVWLNAPPVVSDGVVVATPYDSSTLIGIDLESGALLWSLPHPTVQDLSGGASASIDLLVGAKGGEIFLSGNEIAAIESRSGLRRSAPDVPRWSFSDADFQYTPLGRPVLAGNRILLPLREHRVEIDAETGVEVASTPWNRDVGGNLVVGPGEISCVSMTSATGWFDWDLLTERAHADARAHPNDPARALALGRLLADRAASEWQRGQSDAARAHLAEAEAALEGSLNGLREGEHTPAATEMHRVLRTEARLKAGLADRLGALTALKRARGLAPDAASLRDTLLEEIAILRGSTARDPRLDPAYLDALNALDRSCSDLPVLCDSAAVEDADPGREGTGIPRLVPVVGSVVRRDSTPWEVPVGLWVLLERAGGAASAGDSASELALLHAMLERYADVELSQGSIESIVGERIGRLLRDGRAEGYAAFEARAQKLLDEASGARDPAKLAQVGRLYPHSKAAETADDRRLAWAIEAGDTASVAAIVQSILPRISGGSSGSPWRLAEASDRELRALLRLSSSLSRAGNRELSAELLRTLAAVRGDLRSDLDGDGGRTLAELSAGLPRWRRPDPTPSNGRFRELRRETRLSPGDWTILGPIPPDESARAENPRGDGADAGASLQMYAVVRSSDRGITGFAQVNAIVGQPGRAPDLEFAFEDVRLPLPAPSSTLGVATPPWSRRTALAPGRILIVTATGVSAIDAQGRMAWAWRPEGTMPTSITLGCASGVAIASVDVGSGRRYLQALDARGGIELWRLPILDPGLASQPVLSSNRVVLLPARNRKRCVAVDLFTGRDAVAFQIDAPASAFAPDETWIDGDLLVVPWFLQAREPSQNQVLAYDLATGSRAWRLALGDDRPAPDARPDADRENDVDSRELAAVLQFRDRTWLLVRPPISLGAARPGSGAGDRTPSAAILELTTRIGAAAPLPNVRIAPTDRILGLIGSGRVQIASSVVYFIGNREGSTEARVRAVDLAGGELWSQTLKPAFGEIALLLPPPFSHMPYPALSDDSVALVYSLSSRSGALPSTFVECLDRASGKDLGTVALNPAMGRCDSVQMHPLGTGLLLRGQGGIEVVR